MPVFLHSQNLLVSDHINLVCLPHVLVPDAQQSAHQFLHHPCFFLVLADSPVNSHLFPIQRKTFLVGFGHYQLEVSTIF